MIVFVAWPTCNLFRSNQNYQRWRDLGYKVAVATDLPKEQCGNVAASVPPLLIDRYEGYYRCMNFMAKSLVRMYKADVVIAAGDGIHPHPGVRGHDIAFAFKNKFSNGYGIMQPCGDRWRPSDETSAGTQAWAKHRMHATRPSDQRCESPWIGRTLIMEAEGDGPWSPKYDQYFGDHELHDVARNAGALWMNPAVAQYSESWASGRKPISNYQVKNFERCYEKDWGTYRARRAAGFPAPREESTTEGGLILPS